MPSKRQYSIRTNIERMSSGGQFVHKTFLKRFKNMDKEYQRKPNPILFDQLLKLGNAIGYITQVQGGLAKAVENDKRLSDLEKAIKIRELMKMPEWGK